MFYRYKYVYNSYTSVTTGNDTASSHDHHRYFSFVDRCVVWTGDGRVFFYNPSSRTSVWERPEELSGRTDVDKLVSSPPDAAAEAAMKREAPQESETTPVTKKQKVEPQPQPQPKRTY